MGSIPTHVGRKLLRIALDLETIAGMVKKPIRVDGDAESFVQVMQYRDAITAIGDDSRKLTGKVVAEVAWELGYEKESYDKLLKPFEALARGMGVNLRKEYEEGAKAR